MRTCIIFIFASVLAAAQGVNVDKTDHMLFLHDGSRVLEGFLKRFLVVDWRGARALVTLSSASVVNWRRCYQHSDGEADEQPMV